MVKRSSMGGRTPGLPSTSGANGAAEGTTAPAAKKKPAAQIEARDLVPLRTGEGFAKPPARDKLRGSSTTEARVIARADKDEFDLVSAFGVDIHRALHRALEACTEAERHEAERAIRSIARSPARHRIAVALLSGQSVRDVDEETVRNFDGAQRPVRPVIAALLDWERRRDVPHALGRLDRRVRQALRPTFLQHPDAERVRLALNWITSGAPDRTRSDAVTGPLVRAGCLPDPAQWAERPPEVVEGTDPVDVLASAMEAYLAGHDPLPPAEIEAWSPPAEFRDLVRKLRRAQWSEGAVWAESSLARKRGLLGEALRRDMLEAEGLEISQGVLVVRIPPGLERCQTAAEAVRFCEAHGIPTTHLWRRETVEGAFYCLDITEIDFAVLERDQGALRAVRLENVKSGTGSARKARKQNERALEGWLDPEVHYLFSRPDGYVDLGSELDRSPEAKAHMELLTVGPLGDASYDVSLPLTAEQITRLAELQTDRSKAG